MTSLTLSFNDVNFSPVEHDNQIWLTASELAKALGYARSDAVSKIYERKADEFTPDMTTTVKMGVVRKTGNVQMENRIFNSRGCHLIAMFAKTDIAKQFRKWVLDVLDKVAGKPVAVAKTHKEERTPLTGAVNLLVAKTKHLNYSEAYKLVHQRFNVEHIEDIPYDAIPIAVEYVHHLIALYSKVEEKSSFGNTEYELVRQFIETVLKQNAGLQHIWNGLRYIDSSVFLKCSRFVVDTNMMARTVSQTFDFRNKENEPLLEASCRWINLSSGERIDTNPNFFNCCA